MAADLRHLGLWTIEQIVEDFDPPVSTRTVRRWIAAGKLAPFFSAVHTGSRGNAAYFYLDDALAAHADWVRTRYPASSCVSTSTLAQ